MVVAGTGTEAQSGSPLFYHWLEGILGTSQNVKMDLSYMSLGLLD